MKIEETEKPFLVTRHCFGNSRRKELKAKENTVRSNLNQPSLISNSSPYEL